MFSIPWWVSGADELPSSMPYTHVHIRGMTKALEQWRDRQLELSFALSSRQYVNHATAEFVRHGLARRLSDLRHCLDRVFEVLPMTAEDPDRDSLFDATAFLQSFVINVFGAMDNVARIWCLEANVLGPNAKPLPAMAIGLMPKNIVVRASLPEGFRDYLAAFGEWFRYLESYRHALAHRVPLYIPPRTLNPAAQRDFQQLENEMAAAISEGQHDLYFELRDTQRRAGVFRPMMMHSYGEGAVPMYIHPQMICDFSSVVEISERLMDALDAIPRA
jgi:hypothetical protein